MRVSRGRRDCDAAVCIGGLLLWDSEGPFSKQTVRTRRRGSNHGDITLTFLAVAIPYLSPTPWPFAFRRLSCIFPLFPHTPRRAAAADLFSSQLIVLSICDKWAHGMYRTERRQDMGRGARWQLARVARTHTQHAAQSPVLPGLSRLLIADSRLRVRGRSESDKRGSRAGARTHDLRTRGRLRLAPGSVSRRHFRGAASAVTHGSCRALSSTPCSRVQHTLSVWVPLGGCSRNKGVSRH